MKKHLILLAVFVLVSCKKVDHYEIIGTIGNIPDSSVIHLFELSDNVGSLIASDTIIKGKFKFTGTLTSRPVRMNLFMADRHVYSGSCEFWADYAKIKIDGSGNFLSSWIVSSNIQEQKAANLFLNKTRNQRRKIDSLSLVRITDPGNRDLQISIVKEISSISDTVLIYEFEVLKNNINSLTSLNELYRIAGVESIDKQEIRTLFEKFDEKYKKTLLGEGIMTKLDKPIPPEIGDKLVDLDLYDLDGKHFKLSEFSGRYILLDFWSLACYPCVLAAPELRVIKETYKNDLKIVGISMDADPKLWVKATERDSITWDNLSDGKGSYAGASSIYDINGMPTYIIINPGGTIVDRWEGFGNGIFKERLDKYINKK